MKLQPPPRGQCLAGALCDDRFQVSRRRFLYSVLAASAPTTSARAQEALHGLDITGAADMRQQLQQAVHAAGVDGILRLPPGRIRVGGRIDIPYERQQWTGAGRGVTRLEFTPSADGPLLRFGKMDGITPQQSIHGVSLISADTTFSKTAIELVDTSQFLFDDLEISGANKADGTYTWHGGRDGSIGIRTMGREAPRFGGGCYVSADNPLRVSRNPRRFSPQIDADFFALRDVYMIAHGKPNIVVDGDVELINFLIDGCAMVRGTHAIRWVGTNATRATSAFVVRNSRWEQAEDPDAFAIDLQPNRNLYGLSIDGLSLPPDANGIRLRNCVGPSLRHIICNQSKGKVVLDVDASVSHMHHENCYWGAGTSVAMLGQRVIWATNKTSIFEPLPRNALYDSTNNSKFGISFDGALAGRLLLLPDGETALLGQITARGWLFLVDDEGAACQLALRGPAKSVTYSSATDPAGAYSATAGTTRRTNVYWSERASRYEIENLTGASRQYRLTLVGSWARD